jgi:hypothetical protein
MGEILAVVATVHSLKGRLVRQAPSKPVAPPSSQPKEMAAPNREAEARLRCRKDGQKPSCFSLVFAPHAQKTCDGRLSGYHQWTETVQTGLCAIFA